MAEFLINLIDATHSDPSKDQRGCYKRGDVVVVMPDGHVWGKAECLPKFGVIKIPGMPVETGRKYIQPHEVYAGIDQNGQPVYEVQRRRLYQLGINDVPQAMRDEVLATGSVTVSWVSVKQYVKNKITGVSE